MMHAESSKHVVIAGVPIVLTRKRVKNINMRVRANGTVAVSAPHLTSMKSIELFVEEKRSWIEHAQKRVQIKQERTTFWDEATPKQYEEWKQLVSSLVPPLIAKWEPVLGVRAGKLAFRNMKSRWGSCQPGTGRICISTRLAAYPPECLEYVVVHELCHLIEGGHTPAFYALLDRHFPSWRHAKSLLKNAPCP